MLKTLDTIHNKICLRKRIKEYIIYILVDIEILCNRTG